MYYIGIDVGGMSIKGGLCTADGKIACKAVVETHVYNASYSISEDIKLLIDNLMADANITIKDIVGIGIGHPGSIDSKGGVVRYSNNIAMENVPVVAELKASFDVPIFINNDANCAGLGEAKFGSGKGASDVVFITLGTGVGSGIIIDGKLFEGRECAGAEAGHMVICSDGNICNCGRRGCWETYASASGLIRQTKEAMEQSPDSIMHKIAAREGKVSGKTAFDAAKAGDDAGETVVNRYISYISEGLINIANIFRPELMIIGGGVSHEGAYLTDKLNSLMKQFNFGAKHNPSVTVTTASLGNDAGILGAASLVM